MKSFLFTILTVLVCPADTLPVNRTLRINYKMLKRRTSKFITPLYNRVASYDIGQYNENINKNIQFCWALSQKCCGQAAKMLNGD